MMFIWLIIVILLILIEFITINLTTIWFVISGLVAFLLSFTSLNFFVQFGVFITLGIILLATTKNWLETKFNKKHKIVMEKNSEEK